MLWQTFPPGADIGLHNSVIYSITQSGNTNFLYNYFQMGGGTSLTFPGYHIFASALILMTGLPDYLAQALVVALFSSLIILASYLVTRAAWTESGALIVAFLVAVSRFDIEMTLWGGYPNVITLLLIPLTFYLYLERTRFSFVPFLVATSILVGSIFLTHSLSAVIFIAITIATLLFASIRPSIFGFSRKQVVFWLLPLFLGAILVAPFLFQAVKTYLSSNATLNTALDIKSAILSTKIIPIEIIIPLFLIVCLFFFLSKEYSGRYLSLPTLLFFMWLLIPLVLTQGYLFGLIIDYNRFLYFLLLPVLVLFGMFVDHGSLFLSRVIDTYRSLTSQLAKATHNINKYTAMISKHLSRKNLYAIFVASILIASFLLIPLFVNPAQGLKVGSFYQVMDHSGYEGIQWAKDNTPSGSTFVSDALYGWWLGGFSQHPTISAVSPEYLSGLHELNPAKNASLLLDTDYMIDNGLMQIREDGGYIARHNPEILTKLNWTYFPYSFFNFDSDRIDIFYRINGTSDNTNVSALPVKNMQLQRGPINETTIIISRGNALFNYTQMTTVYQNTQFVNVTARIDSTVSGIMLDYLIFNVESKGTIIQQNNSTIAWVDQGVKALGQLIFYGNIPEARTTLNTPPPYDVTLKYSLNGGNGTIQMAVGSYSVTDDPNYYSNLDSTIKHFSTEISRNLDSPYRKNDGKLIDIVTFDYHTAIQQYNVSYIANRIADQNPKFAGDPTFSLVFINDKVAIFKVETNANQVGR